MSKPGPMPLTLVPASLLRQTHDMIGLLQRVTEANVSIAGEIVGAIDRGLLVLVGVEKSDTEAEAERLAQRLLNYRVFADQQGRMNLNVTQVKGELLLVPQFTLIADTEQGNRPGFSRAADPAKGSRLFTRLVNAVQQSGLHVETGRFGADMQVRLCNDGPVTISLSVSAAGSKGA